MTRYLKSAALVGVLALTGLVSASLAGAEAPADAPKNQCFFSNQWQGWNAPDAHTMYIRVNLNRIYRLDFASACQTMTWPDVHLITKINGPDTICSPVDWDLKVSDGHGFEEPCIVSKMTELTPDQVKALPRKSLP